MVKLVPVRCNQSHGNRQNVTRCCCPVGVSIRQERHPFTHTTCSVVVGPPLIQVVSLPDNSTFSPHDPALRMGHWCHTILNMWNHDNLSRLPLVAISVTRPLHHKTGRLIKEKTADLARILGMPNFHAVVCIFRTTIPFQSLPAI